MATTPKTDLQSILLEITGANNLYQLTNHFRDFLGGRNGGELLRHLIYLCDTTSRSNGWVACRYEALWQKLRLSEYQVRRCVDGDPRGVGGSITLAEVGIERMVRMAPDGRNACHYRINIEGFLTAFTDWWRGTQPNADPLQQGIKKWGPVPTKYRDTLDTCWDTLGNDAFESVLQRCVRYGAGSWAYVLKSLRGEIDKRSKPRQQHTTSEQDSHQPYYDEPALTRNQPEITIHESIQSKWNIKCYKPDTTVYDLWQNAREQMRLQFGCQFTYVQDARLVHFTDDNQPTLMLALPAEWHLHELEILRRNIERILKNTFADEKMAFEAVTFETWSAVQRE